MATTRLRPRSSDRRGAAGSSRTLGRPSTGGADPSSGPPTGLSTDPSSGPWTPLAIRSERCKGCGLCVHACPHAALELEVTLVNALGYHPVRLVDAGSCTSCAICARVCPDAVFTVLAHGKERAT